MTEAMHSKTSAQAEKHPAGLVQHRAADPRRSVWVGASAGTGKTKVLIDRVMRLMLPHRHRDAEGRDILIPGTPPQRILCLTYTNTAAAEMSNRIYKSLSRWSVMADDALAERLEELTGEKPDERVCAAARRLFAQVLDAPGGLKIKTIHAFCQSVLKRFPVESGLPPHFGLLDERGARDLLIACQHEMMAAARLPGKEALAAAFHELALRLDADGLTRLLQEIMARRAFFARLLAAAGGVEGLCANVYEHLGVAPGSTVEDALKACTNLPPTLEGDLRRYLAAVADVGSEALRRDAAVPASFLEATGDARLVLFSGFRSFFVTTSGTCHSRRVVKAVREALPDADEIIQRAFDHVQAVEEKMIAQRQAAATVSLLRVGADLMSRYEEAKRQRDQLDFEDLVLRTQALLADVSARWVLYKLDDGLDHILVDEAQDTSPAQWQVIARLAEEFFAGAGARDRVTRTLFVVGDEKQSIFSFQGADPSAFQEMKAHFAEKTQAVQEGFALDLHYSFRSTAAVLKAVDCIFNEPDVRAGVVAATGQEVLHLPFRKGQAGEVVLWPLVRPAAAPAAEEGGWAPDARAAPVEAPQDVLVARIARTIAGWIEKGEMLAARGRPVRAGDVLILLRSRGPMVQALRGALRREGVAVAGVDRMTLQKDIGILDLMALARFALQPRDDLSLAEVLKSPLVGLDEEGLARLCLARAEGQGLWPHVQDARRDLADWLRPLVASAGRATPYEFFAGVLALPCPGDETGSGRRALFTRLGEDLADTLDEFLSVALSFEQSHIPSLEMFCDWFFREATEIKRQQEGAGADQVRIMTVHAAKGLQAPIVFLPDTTSLGFLQTSGKIRLVWPESAGQEPPLWAERKDEQTRSFRSAHDRARQRQDEEYRRLFYVALTRAEDRLYICGATNRKGQEPSQASWYQIAARSFPPEAEVLADGTRIFRQPQSVPVVAPPPDVAAVSDDGVERPAPGWIRQVAVTEPSPSKPLSPSRPEEEEPAAKSPLADDDSARRFSRGKVLHRLLEALPALPPETWDETIRRFLARPGFSLAPAAQTRAAEEMLAVLRHPDFAPIFGPGSRAEVPLVGVATSAAGKQVVVSGQVDRLLVTDKTVLVVDFKTNRPPPKAAADVAPAYLKQMAAYAALLQKIYPSREVRCALLWTDGPMLMPLPVEMLSRHFSLLPGDGV